MVAAAGVELDTTEFELGAARYLRDGSVLPTRARELRGYDAILLGAVGPPVGRHDRPPGILERGLLLRLRFELDLYVNLRPFNGAPGSIADGADFVVVRENTEGTYAGEGGFLRKGTRTRSPPRVRSTPAWASSAASASPSTWPARPRHHLTLVHKTNVLTFAGDLWQRTFDEVAAEYPEVSTAYNHVDAACIYLVERAERYDVIVTDNLFGDILTDLGRRRVRGHRAGGSANLNPARTGPSLFEPVHGSAHDIAGHGQGQPGGRHPLGRADAGVPGRVRRRRPCHQGRRRPVRRHVSRPRGPGCPRPPIGDAIAERV